MSSYWEKLLDVVDRTKEKIFFFSANRTYVVMSLEQYEHLVMSGKVASSGSMTEEELLEKINRDIATWKAHTAESHEDEVAASMITDTGSTALPGKEEQNSDDEFHIEPVEM